MTGSQAEKTRELELSGAVHRLNDGSQIAIYLRRGVAWVAHFRGGTAELFTAGEWFRLHRPPRAPRLMHEVAAGSVSRLPDAVAARIEALHCKVETPVTSPWISTLLRAAHGLLARSAAGFRRSGVGARRLSA